MTTVEEKEVELKKWIVENLMALEFGQLEKNKSDKLIEFFKDNAPSPFINECFDTFYKIRADFYNEINID